MDETPDRPLECSSCKKPICFIYKEIDQNLIDSSHMCRDCPILQKKLHGETPVDAKTSWANGKQGLSCVHCNTSLNMCDTGQTLGCSECYSVFEEPLIEIIKNEKLIPEKLQKALEKNHKPLLHLGKTPQQEEKNPISLQVTDLTKALYEALNKENYEQAASLRDQIKRLQASSNESL
ncbi:MAG: UvrB/UvrC motif-containing protein [Chlamydiota bacterium]